MKKVDVKNKLEQLRDESISGDALLAQYKAILAADDNLEDQILYEIQNGNVGNDGNIFDVDILSADRIFTENQIKKICTIYRLRFLDSKYFKDNLPYEALLKTKELQKQHQTTLKGFKILAPGKAFKLKNADDPLLFAPMGKGYYYLIHKWGNDLNFWRKLKMWPLRGLEHMAVTVFLFSFIFVHLIPARFINAEMTTPKYLLFAFIIFQWFGGLVLFYFIKKGKNFSPNVWNSKYINA